MIRRYSLRRSDNFPYSGTVTYPCTGTGSLKVYTGFQVTSASISYATIPCHPDGYSTFSSSSSSSVDFSSYSSSSSSMAVLYVTGSGTLDCDGYYEEYGVYASYSVYYNRIKSKYIWYSTGDAWWIMNHAVGVEGGAQYTNASLLGTYSPILTTGNPIVTDVLDFTSSSSFSSVSYSSSSSSSSISSPTSESSADSNSSSSSSSGDSQSSYSSKSSSSYSSSSYDSSSSISSSSISSSSHSSSSISSSSTYIPGYQCPKIYVSGYTDDGFYVTYVAIPEEIGYIDFSYMAF